MYIYNFNILRKLFVFFFIFGLFVLRIFHGKVYSVISMRLYLKYQKQFMMTPHFVIKFVTVRNEIET